MNKAVVLIGTSHAYQRGGESCSLSEITAFQDFISSICKQWGIEVIAEEMSLGALKEYELTESTVAQVASSHSIQHQYVDPDREQRRGLRILEPSDVSIHGQFNDWSASKIQRQIRAEYKKRESVWLSSLRLIDRWPCLFVCGSEHVKSFSKLLRGSKLAVHIAAIDWAP